MSADVVIVASVVTAVASAATAFLLYCLPRSELSALFSFSPLSIVSCKEARSLPPLPSFLPELGGELIKLQKNIFDQIIFSWLISNLKGVNNMFVNFFAKKLTGSVPLEGRKLRF